MILLPRTMTAEFKRQPILQYHTIGERLRAARQGQRLQLNDLGAELKINPQHLRALEEGRYNDFSSPVYIKNYLRRYTQRLGIAWSTVADQYEQEIRVFHATPSPVVSQQRPKGRARGSEQHRGAERRHSASGVFNARALMIPRLFKMGIAGMVALLLVVYFVLQVVQFLSPPPLTVIAPATDVIATDRKIQVSGTTDPEMIVEINGQRASVQPNGDFTETVFLHDGLNTLRITARSKRSQERVVVRNVLVDPQGRTGE